VTYNANGFLVKNGDKLSPAVWATLRRSQDPIVEAMGGMPGMEFAWSFVWLVGCFYLLVILCFAIGRLFVCCSVLTWQAKD
jgi:hypothetical protein